jgi:hypothetical protein
MLRRQLTEFTHELPVSAESKLRIDAMLERHEEQLVQPLRRYLREGLVLEIGEGWAAPSPSCCSLYATSP